MSTAHPINVRVGDLIHRPWFSTRVVTSVNDRYITYSRLHQEPSYSYRVTRRILQQRIDTRRWTIVPRELVLPDGL